jgi:hypothetical protein
MVHPRLITNDDPRKHVIPFNLVFEAMQRFWRGDLHRPTASMFVFDTDRCASQ